MAEYQKVYRTLQEQKLDAYLIYDFRGSNYVGRQILGFEGHTTRRWVAVFKARGELCLIVPELERSLFDSVAADKLSYQSYEDFHSLLKDTLSDHRTVASDYSPGNDIPVQDIVPAGFLESLRSLAPQVQFESSLELTQYLSSLWGERGLALHREATKELTEIQNLVFDLVREKLSAGEHLTDYEVRKFIIGEYKKRNLITDHDVCIAATAERTGNPHYWPTEELNYPISKNSVLLIDIWAKKNAPGAVFSDSTFMAWIGPDPVPAKVAEVWEAVRDARDAGIECVMSGVSQDLRGYQVDRVVRDLIIERGYGSYFVHRTGHSIDTNDHGSGADLDDLEKRDMRRIIPDTGFSIEPGVYLPGFGMRSEINMYVDPNGKAEVTTHLQKELRLIDFYSGRK